MEAPSSIQGAGMVTAERSGALIKPRQPYGAGMPIVFVRRAVRREVWKGCFEGKF